MKKVFGIAVMLLALAACNKVETEIQPVENNEGIPFSATISIGHNDATKALTESGNTIVATWAVDETVALIHNSVKDVMTVSAVNEGVATITGTVTHSPSDGDDVTVIYPASAADGTTGNIKADLLYAQNGLLTGDGSIAANYDARIGTGKLKVSGTKASLNGNMTLDNQFAIFKFTIKNTDGSATIKVKSLTITIGEQNYVITPASATSVLYAALPAISGQAVIFTATGSNDKTYTASKASITFTAGKYYQSVIKIAATGHELSASAFGEVVGTDGLAYIVADKDNLPTGVTAAGMVAYKNGSNGLVIALLDALTGVNWNTATGKDGASAYSPPVTGKTWKVPSKDEWTQMCAYRSCKNLNSALNSAGGSPLRLNEGYNNFYYWSSSSSSQDSQSAWCVHFDGEGLAEGVYAYKDNGNYKDFVVRACFAF